MSPDAHRDGVLIVCRAGAETRARSGRPHLTVSVLEVSRTRRPATCTWSSSLMSIKAGTLIVKAGLRKTLRSRTTPTGKGRRAALCYAQPLPGQAARAGLVGGASSITSFPRASDLLSTPRGLLPETPAAPGNLGRWG